MAHARERSLDFGRAHGVSGIVLPQHLPLLRVRDVRVALRRLHGGVAEEALGVPQVDVVLEEHRREGVPEHVRRDVGLHAWTAKWLERHGGSAGAQLDKAAPLLSSAVCPLRHFRRLAGQERES